MIAQVIDMTPRIVLSFGVVVLVSLALFGLAKLFRFVICPHCQGEFFVPIINSNPKCPNCGQEL